MGKPRYSVEVWRGESGKGFCYRVVNPEGEEIIGGARADSEEGTRAQVEKFIRRAEMHACRDNWIPDW